MEDARPLGAATASPRARAGDLERAVLDCLYDARSFPDAIAHAMQLLALEPESLLALDALAHAHAELGDAAAAARFGRRALERRDASVPGLDPDAWPLPRSPRPFDPADPGRNAIAYSLFGAEPRYCEQLLMNVEDQPSIYPGWHARVYVDDTVPGSVVARLERAGARVHRVAAVDARLPGTMWRFLAHDDPSLERVMFRDADSELSEREAAAMREWTESDRFFHVMRDWGSHTELLLAGLWAVARGGMPPLAPRMRQFVASAASGRHADQIFLRRVVWPHARRSVLQHDSMFGFLASRPFPGGPRLPGFSVGIGGSPFSIGTDHPPGTRVEWVLETLNGDRAPRALCRHPALVEAASVVRGTLPRAWAEGIVSGRLTMRVEPAMAGEGLELAPPQGSDASEAPRAAAVLAQAGPEATFFIPVYNGVAFLAEAIESVLAQRGVATFELLLVDDASQDGSARIIDRFASDPRVRVVRNPANLNVAQASNVALRVARGRYLLRLDQDDLALPERLQWQLDFMERRSDVHVLGGNMLLFGEAFPARTRLPAEDGAIKAGLLPATGHFANPTVCLRLEFFRARRLAHRPPAPPADDYGLWVDAMIAGARFANLPQVLTHYRIHGAQNSRDAAATRAAVAPIRRRLLRHWYPDLSEREVRMLEPILHGYSDVVMDVAEARAGLAAGARALALPQRPVHGEDRQAVCSYIAERLDTWRGLLGGASRAEGSSGARRDDPGARIR